MDGASAPAPYEKIQTEDGALLLRDAGVFSIVGTDDLRTLELISSQVVVDNGPHPELDSDFARYCEVITTALR